ncbi:DNA repair protein RecO [Candidatus Saccharibacteria bacterium RIFCSPLOWO2_01_FULL_48_13]|nr:MAG: DNA repair protein RecO [Candidatus Saccharibacteria bacterium RIFCSPHIGHO2_12_FULL_48_21]OGL36626.1 MAG: DNA repair protein RecO [Candidatus Saccharibacteria bacterium RIFCSPLOWO2_01_FULL_48_13]
MRSFKTEAIILARTNYGEADRIMTFLTPDHGKVKAIAKAVRKSKSKLAGGLELFSVSNLTLVIGRGEINTVISTQLKSYYGNIASDLDRTELGYRFIKLIDNNTEASCDNGYFYLLQRAFAALNDSQLKPELINLWFNMALLRLSGHAPNLYSDVNGSKLLDSASYDFAHERMHFVPKLANEGIYNANHIKFLRLGFAADGPNSLAKVTKAAELVEDLDSLIAQMLKIYLRT